MYKRVIVILTAVMVLVAAMMLLLSCSVFASDGFTVSKDGKTLEKYTGNDEVVVIPDGIETIGSGAFFSNEDVKKIVMPDTVKVIEYGAFRNCTKINEIKWSGNLKRIEYAAFDRLMDIEQVILPDSVEFIGDYAFSCCYRLKYVKLPDKITSIGENSFESCSDLRALVVPDNVTEIGAGALNDCYENLVVVAGADSAAAKYARKKKIAYSTKGVEVDYKAECDKNGEFKVVYNGKELGGKASLKVGDVVYITAHTSSEDLNITVNGKSLNYEFFTQETKNELNNYPMVITGPTELELTSVSKGKSLDDSMNGEGSNLHFTGHLADHTVTRGRRCGTFTATAQDDEEGYISTTVDLKKDSYLMFDMMQIQYGDVKMRVKIDDTVYRYGDPTAVPLSYVFEVPAGKHTITWYDTDEFLYNFSVVTISNVRITDDINEVHARAFSIAFPQIDLDMGESLALEYTVQPAMLSGKIAVKWQCENENIARIENGTITGVSKGSTVVSGTIDGVKAYVNCYVSDRPYNMSEDEDDEYDDSGFITGRTAITDEAASIYKSGTLIDVEKNDRYAYFFNDKSLYRVDPIIKTSAVEVLMTTEQVIKSASVRGKIIYLLTAESGKSSKCTITGYDTKAGSVVYSQDFPYTSSTDPSFAVDDSGNVFFVRDKKDIYSYSSDGRFLSSDLQSTDTLITGLGDIHIDQVDPYSYSVLVLYENTEGRALTVYGDYITNSLDNAFNYLLNKFSFTGCRMIRNGEILNEKNYIKTPNLSIYGGLWSTMTKGNYAVNENGILAKFRKDKKHVIGSDFDCLYKITDMKKQASSCRPKAVYADGDVYVLNNKNVIYRYDTKTEKIEGTYNFGRTKVHGMYVANGKVYVVGKDSEYFAMPLGTENYDEAKTILRQDHVTLSYSPEEVLSRFKASQTTVNFHDDSEVFDEVPSTKSPYAAGKLSEAAAAATLGRLNFARWQCGLSQISLKEDCMERSQKGAVVMAATDELTHKPKQPSDMDDEFYKEAYKGCNADIDYSGNCGYGDVYDAVDGYLDDTANMISGSIGHRLSLLDKKADKTSFGFAGMYSCMSMYYASDGNPQNDESYYAWPSAGYFAAEMLSPNAYWHIVTDWYSYSESDDVKVSLTYNGKKYEAESVETDHHYNARYFMLPAALKKATTKNGSFKDGVEITVRMEGLQDDKGNDIVVEYPVRFVNSNSAQGDDDDDDSEDGDDFGNENGGVNDDDDWDDEETEPIDIRASQKFKYVTPLKKTIKAGRSFKLKAGLRKGNGKITFKKVSGSTKIKISKAGKVTVKKGLKKGRTYRLKVKVTAAATRKYKAATTIKTIKIKVK